MRSAALFGAILAQWGVPVDIRQDHSSERLRAAAFKTRDIKGSGRLIVSKGDGIEIVQRFDSMYEAACSVLEALAMLSIDALVTSDFSSMQRLRPEMFTWVPDKRDVTTTRDADAVIAKIKESL